MFLALTGEEGEIVNHYEVLRAENIGAVVVVGIAVGIVVGVVVRIVVVAGIEIEKEIKLINTFEMNKKVTAYLAVTVMIDKVDKEIKVGTASERRHEVEVGAPIFEGNVINGEKEVRVEIEMGIVNVIEIEIEIEIEIRIEIRKAVMAVKKKNLGVLVVKEIGKSLGTEIVAEVEVV